MNVSKLDIRGLRYHVSEWGDSNNPVLVLLHGWMDCSATFSQVAEQLCQHYYVIAPDLRGFGLTQHAPGYWFPDYFADLEALLNYYSPNHAARIVGHSMGGNIALMYAGISPERVSAVMSLEALGMAPTTSDDAPKKYRRWMREILSGEPSKVYPNEETLRQSIRKGNPKLSEPVVNDLVMHWGEPHGDQGAFRLKHDHKHRYTNPVRYNFDDVVALWKEVTARVGIVMAEESGMYLRFEKRGRIAFAKEVLRVREKDYFLVSKSDHMLHLEQPKDTADCIIQFFAGIGDD